MANESKGVTEVRKLSEKIGGERETAYALEPVKGKLGDGAISRVFGVPIGIGDQEWPKKPSGTPLIHMLSLDFKEAPELARHNARAVSIFVDDPDVNDCLFEPNPLNARIVFLSEAQIASGVTAKVKAKPARPIKVTPLSVPTAAFTTDVLDFEEGTPLEKLYNALFGLEGLAAKQPIWTSMGYGHKGKFVLQFSELLVPINLGDSGTMYVFDDVAFFQGM